MRWVAVMAALLASACGDDGTEVVDAARADGPISAGDAGGGDDARTVSPSLQVVAYDCAPGDAASIRLLFTDGGVDAECRYDLAGETVEIYLYTRDITAPQTLSFAPDDFEGSATHCPGGLAPCVAGETGTVSFDTYEADIGASGSFWIELNGYALQGDFDADWCEPPQPVVCG